MHMLKEIRIHGRGGQGVVTSSELLAIAAFNDGKQSQAFPNFGVERSGAPVEAFVRISDEKINLRQQVYKPDYVIVLDASLLSCVDVLRGLKSPEGYFIINSDKEYSKLGLPNLKMNAAIVDVSKKAIEILGKPMVNVGVLGAFAAITKEVSLPSLLKAIDQEFESKKEIAEKNKNLAELLYKENIAINEGKSMAGKNGK